jgi:AcrR family transcriptional regulator
MEPIQTRRSTYHHGNLKAALLEAAITLIEEKGPDAVTVAEAGKRAGVSSGAPFRHFESKTALMTAVAEVFQAELVEVMQNAAATTADPWESLRLMGRAFAGWGLNQPARYRTYSNRHLFDFESSPILVAGDQRLMDMVTAPFERLLPEGPDRALRAKRLYVNSRGLLNGLLTMYCNGQFPRLQLPQSPQEIIETGWELFIEAFRPDRLRS